MSRSHVFLGCAAEHLQFSTLSGRESGIWKYSIYCSVLPLLQHSLQELFLREISAQSFIFSECSITARIYLAEEAEEQLFAAFGSQ